MPEHAPSSDSSHAHTSQVPRGLLLNGHLLIGRCRRDNELPQAQKHVMWGALRQQVARVQAIDKDNSGTITSDELEAGMKNQGTTLDGRDLRNLLVLPCLPCLLCLQGISFQATHYEMASSCSTCPVAGNLADCSMCLV